MTGNRPRPVRVEQADGRLRRNAGLSEDELLELARTGDHDAIGRLLSPHQDAVYTLALRLVGERELAADVAQEALVRAWRALPGFRGDAKLSTWLHRITVNTAWTMRRRWSRGDTTPLESLAELPSASALDPAQAAVDLDLADRIADAIRSLSGRLRAVVVLKDIYGWTHPEIAEHLGISVTAAKVRLHRARTQLRTELEQRDVRP